MLAKGTRLGRYEIVGLIGAGGMGEVYRARDTRLGRDVAVKVLPDGAAHPERVARMEREARAVASLDHPNILAIFDAGTAADGSPYLITEFLQGQTLRARLGQGLPSVNEAIRIVREVAEALHAAHLRGVVHRDVKPENVFLTADGRVKVLDFGVARLRHPGGAASVEPGPSAGETITQTALTDRNSMPGTPGYMSPEQLRNGHVDARSDVFALGILLYEALTGRSPFRREAAADTIAAILSDAPPRLDLASVLPSIACVLEECLRKRPEERYQSAHDVALALGAALSDTGNEIAAPPAPRRFRHWPLAVGVAGAVIAAVAVLAWYFGPRSTALTARDSVVVGAFENRTGDPIFDDTLQESLLIALRQSPFLDIAPEPRVTETLRLMLRPPDSRLTPALAREVAVRLGAKAVIAGSIARLGARYVVTLQGVSSNSGAVFADAQAEADRPEDVIKGLGQAVRGLRRPLGESLTSIERYDKPLEEATTSSLEALKAYTESTRLTGEGRREESLTAAKRAVKIDPRFAMGWRQLSVAAWNLDLVAEADGYAAKAFALRDGVTEPERYALANEYYWGVTGELANVVANAQQWQQAYPRDSRALVNLALALSQECRREEAIAVCREGLGRLEAMALRTNLGDSLLITGHPEKAKGVVEETRRRYPEARSGHVQELSLAFLEGDMPKVDAIVREAEGKPYEIDVLVGRASRAIGEGRLSLAHELNRRAIAKADASGFTELAHSLRLDVADEALAAGCGGLSAEGRIDQAAVGPLLASDGGSLGASLGVALARCGRLDEALRVSHTLRALKPLDTRVAKVSAPVIDAAVALQRGQFEQALESLKESGQFDECHPRLPYLRGLAYRGLRRETEAIAELEKVNKSQALFPMATLERARALSATGAAARSRDAYQQLFVLWKNADPDFLPLNAARAEHARLR